MEKLIFIKYFYTSNEIEQMFEEMQVIVEDLIESEFPDSNVYLHFIDVSQAAYLCDIIEVEHNFDLNKEAKEKIFNICQDNIYFVDDLDKSQDTFIEMYDKSYNLMFAKFKRINDEVILKKSQPM